MNMPEGVPWIRSPDSEQPAFVFDAADEAAPRPAFARLRMESDRDGKKSEHSGLTAMVYRVSISIVTSIVEYSGAWVRCRTKKCCRPLLLL